MSYLHMEKPLSPDGKEVAETGYERDSPVLSFFSGFWDLFLLKMLV